MDLIAQVNATRSKVVFFTHAIPGTGLDRIDVSNRFATSAAEATTSLIGWSSQKSLAGASGHVAISLTGTMTYGAFAGKPWTDLIHIGDWWAIDTAKNGVEQGGAFGVIDSIRVVTSAGGQGEPTIRIVVTGRTYGYALEDTPVYFNPFDPAIDNAVGMNMIAILDKIAGAPHLVIESMVRGFMGNLGVGEATTDGTILGGYIEVPPGIAGGATGKRWIDLLDTTSCMSPNLKGEVVAFGAITPTGSPSVWAFVDAWRNPAMNELFVDEVPQPGFPKQARLIMREKPFVNVTDGPKSAWFSLTTWCVDARLVEGSDLEHGAFRINHVQLTGDMVPAIGTDSYGLYIPRADRSSIKRYGLKRLEDTSSYFDDQGEAMFAGPSGSPLWVGLVISWNALNAEYLSGSIRLGELRTEIRIGQKIAIVNGPIAGFPGMPAGGVLTPPRSPADPKALTFYVEAVAHDYLEGESPACSTTLTVSRGYVEGKRVAAVTAAFYQYSGIDGQPLPLPAPLTSGVDLNVEDDARLVDPTDYASTFGQV